MEETVMTEEMNEERETISPEDMTSELYAERSRCRREGKLEDTAAVQGIICLVAAIALVILNFRMPDKAEEIFVRLKESSQAEYELFENPIDTIWEFVDKLCQK